MRHAIWLVIALLWILSLAIPAKAHTTEELEQATTALLEEARYEGITVELIDEWRTLIDNHAWWFTPPPPPATRARSSTNPQQPAPAVNAGVEQWRPLVAAYFPADQVDRALCIMWHESRGDPTADNPTSSAAGLFQFLRSTWDWVADELGGPAYDTGAPYDPETNTRYAAWLQATGGWTHWSPYNRGLCR